MELTSEQKSIIKAIEKEAIRQGLDPDFAIAIANVESQFRNIPANKPKSSAFGPFQVNRDTAETNGIDYDEMIKNPDLAIKAGILNLVRHSKNPNLGGDPVRIAAAHNRGENSNFAKTGDRESIDKELADYLSRVSSHFSNEEFPENVYSKPSEDVVDQKKEEVAPPTIKPAVETKKTTPISLPLAGMTGAVIGGGLGIKAAFAKAKFDALKKGYEKLQSGKTDSVVPERIEPSLSTEPKVRPTPTQPVSGRIEPSIYPNEAQRARSIQGTMKDEGVTGRQSQTSYQARTQNIAEEAKRREKIYDDLKRAGLVTGDFSKLYEYQHATPSGVLLKSAEDIRSAFPPIEEPLVSTAPAVEPVPKSGGALRYALGLAKYPALGALTGAGVGMGLAEASNLYRQGEKQRAAQSAAETTAPIAAPLAAQMLGYTRAATPIGIAASVAPLLYHEATRQPTFEDVYPERYRSVKEQRFAGPYEGETSAVTGIPGRFGRRKLEPVSVMDEYNP